jgi:hypothetical protein
MSIPSRPAVVPSPVNKGIYQLGALMKGTITVYRAT